MLLSAIATLPAHQNPPSQIQFWQETGVMLEKKEILEVTFSPETATIKCPTPASAFKIFQLSKQEEIPIKILVSTEEREVPFC